MSSRSPPPSSQQKEVNIRDVASFLSSLTTLSTTTSSSTDEDTSNRAAAKWNEPKTILVAASDDGSDISKTKTKNQRTVRTLSGVSYVTNTTTDQKDDETSCIDNDKKTRSTDDSGGSVGEVDQQKPSSSRSFSSTINDKRQLDITYPMDFLNQVYGGVGEDGSGGKDDNNEGNKNKTDLSPLPVLIHVHGGGWSRGSKDQYFYGAPSICENISAMGCLTISVGYRLGNYPTFMYDVATAIQYIYNNIKRLGGDFSRVYISGHSAGGHIVSLLMIRYADFLQNNNNNNTAIIGGVNIPYGFFQGVILLSGVYDLFCPLKKSFWDTKNKFFLVGYVLPAFGLNTLKRKNASPLLLLNPNKDTSFLGNAAKALQDKFASLKLSSFGSSSSLDDVGQDEQQQQQQRRRQKQQRENEDSKTNSDASSDAVSEDDDNDYNDEVVTINTRNLPRKILLLNAYIDMGLQENGQLMTNALKDVIKKEQLESEVNVEHHVVSGTDHASICWNKTTFHKMKQVMEL